MSPTINPTNITSEGAQRLMREMTAWSALPSWPRAPLHSDPRDTLDSGEARVVEQPPKPAHKPEYNDDLDRPPLPEERSFFERQEGIIAHDKLRTLRAAVIGCGSVGSRVVEQLVFMGIGELVLIDPDIIGRENVSNQGWRPQYIGEHKVRTLKTMYHTLFETYPRVNIWPIKFTPPIPVPPIVFCCVDSMADRRFIFEAIGDEIELFADARTGGGAIRIVSFTKDADYYESTLQLDAESFQGECTTQGTLYLSQIAAGLLVSELTRHLKGIPRLEDYSFSTLTGEATFLRNSAGNSHY